MDLKNLYVLALSERYGRGLIKFNRFLIASFVLAPGMSWAAGTADFSMAAQLLTAARNGNTRMIQNLINSGADINYIDSTGLSVVCTAVMNNDTRAVQVLQMYGADASQCDRQIKNYRARNNPTADSGLFSGLSSTHKLVLTAAGVGVVIAGLLWVTDAFESDNGNSGGSGSSGGHGGSGGGGGDSSTGEKVWFSLADGYCQEGQCEPSFWENLNGNGTYMTNNGINYLSMTGAYNAFARGYLGLTTWRGTNNAPINLANYTATAGGKNPVLVAMVTQSGINLEGSIADMNIEYIDSCDGTTCTPGAINKIYNNSTLATPVVFNLGSGDVFGSAIPSDTKLAKIISGYTSNLDTGESDWVGVAPNSTLAVFKTGGKSESAGYQNYHAMYNAANIPSYNPAAVVNLENIDDSDLAGYYTLESARTVVSETASDKKVAYQTLINNKYNTAGLTSETPAYYADLLFSATDNPIVVMSAGNNDYSSYVVQEATFENYVPAVYTNMEHLFATVVAVAKGSNNMIGLTAWDTNSDSVVDHVSRKCGLAGKGDSGVDPWCFAAPGMNDLKATATMAGAVGLLKGAFDYLSNEKIFTLLAMTADGAYLETNPSSGGLWGTTETEATNNLVSYLKTKYTMSVYNDALTGESYLDAFKEYFGYGLINLDRATTPGKSVYYYTDGKIVSANGNAYWRSAQNSTIRSSSVFGARGAVIPVSFYDVLTDIDSTVAVPRVWNMELSLGADTTHGLYLGDTLAELKTHDVDNTVAVGNLKFGFARSEKYYDDNMNGVDDLSLSYENSHFGLSSGYQHYLTDGAGRFGGMANPVLSLVSNAVSTGAEFKSGRFAIMGRGFVGEITNEGLLENDPGVSNSFAAAKLGDVVGVESGLQFNGEKLSLATNIGNMRESGTVLGGQFVELLDGADTNYVDAKLKYNVTPDIDFALRGTFAWTDTMSVSNGIINGISELKSNAFAANVRFKKFDLAVSMPLALIDGRLNYSHADFIVDDNNNLQIKNAGEYAVDLTPEKREYRFNASYRHKFGDWTDGALGFIYRVHPNNTDAFGNESIFMMKLSHRLGI